MAARLLVEERPRARREGGAARRRRPRMEGLGAADGNRGGGEAGLWKGDGLSLLLGLPGRSVVLTADASSYGALATSW